MTAPTLLALIPAFVLGCILTEIRWIVRMRRLQGEVGLREASREGPSIDTVADFGTALNQLCRHLSGETPVSPLREEPATIKS